MISMDVCRLCFVLVLQLFCMCLGSEVTLVKTIGKEPDFTQLCINETLNIIILIVCKIRRERSWREECRLLYRYGHDFVHQCDSRFTLMTENQTVFLHLNDLTPADSGSYTCECSSLSGTFTLHLNITVREDQEVISTKGTSFSFPLIAAVAAIITAGIILGICFRRKSYRGGWLRSETSGLAGLDTHGSLDEDKIDNPYASLQQRTTDVYQTVSRIYSP